ncbi:PQQ-binding-like beta-propeller repeat protein [Sphingoaurantiacus capsulatus]|uniref:PQQ-binding-like beta-propeller repeat protein n=1 Tax=Sphingoaurantiacus capsulatus TaxID=1771310 RepID=A0ABV7X952_9SPHN
MKRSIVILLAASLAVTGCGVFGSGNKKSKTPVLGERLPVLTYEAKVEADPDLAEVTVTLPEATANDAWSQPGGNAAKSMGHLQLSASPARAWTASIGEGSSKTARLNATPVVAGGRVYTIDTTATVRAFNAQTGAVVWSSRITKEREKTNVAFGGGVSVEGGRVYATSGYGIAAAFDAATGAQAWRVDLGNPLRGAPSIEGDRVYVLSQDNQLFTLATADGKTLWDSTGTVEQTGLLGAGAPAVAQDTAVVGFSSGELNALRVENGRVAWQDALARTGRTTALAALADIDASPVIDRGRVFAIGHGGRMAALELATGQRVWERNLAGTSTPWVAGDYIYAVTVEGELVAVTRGEGKVKWVRQLQKWRNEEDKKGPIQWSGPVLAGDRLYLTSTSGQLVAVSPLTGEIQNSMKIDGVVYLPPVVASGMLFVLTDEGRLLAYR